MKASIVSNKIRTTMDMLYLKRRRILRKYIVPLYMMCTKGSSFIFRLTINLWVTEVNHFHERIYVSKERA